MRVLISGAGIAGPTLAYWLAKYGHEPTIIECAPRLRTGGYMIDFWGAGFDVAERMGLLPRLGELGYMFREVRVVDERGKRVTGFTVDSLAEVTKGRYVSIPRGDLAALIYQTIEKRVETIFGESISGIEEGSDCVRVNFEKQQPREFDLVIGADGLHSKVRSLVFGAEEEFEKYLGYQAAAFSVVGYRPGDELVYVMFTEVGQQAARFAMRGDRTTFLFIFADDNPGRVEAGDVAGQKALLRKRFGGSGWECAEILESMERADELYFDRVSQIRMNPQRGMWTRGRVSLVGDAASCVSLLAGQGSALAMSAAYILAGELHRAGDNYSLGFTRYQRLFGPLVAGKQKAALRFAGAFAPRSRLGLFLRNQVFRAMALPAVANFAVGRSIMDKIELPEY